MVEGARRRRVPCSVAAAPLTPTPAVPQAVPPPAPAAAPDDVSTRLAALEAMALLRPADLAEHAAVFATKLEDSNSRVRRAAVDTLGKLDVATLALYEQAMAKAAKEDEYLDVRHAADEVLAKLQAGK